jgi:hypothetical protein
MASLSARAEQEEVAKLAEEGVTKIVVKED